MRIKIPNYISLWAGRLALYFVIYVAIICSHLYFSRFDFWHTDVDSARYMLSSLIQSEAAIVALVVTLSLVAMQLAASSYSTRVIELFIKTPDLLILILIYVITIFYGLGVLKLIEKADPQKCAEKYICQSNLEPNIAFTYYLGVFAFVALVPYILNTMKLLKPAPLFDMLAKEITKSSILEYIDNEQRKTDKEDPIQPIIDIVHGSIMKYDYETARVGLRAIGNSADDIFRNENINKQEKDKIAEHIFSHLVSVGQLAISIKNERSTLEVITILCANGITAVEQRLEKAAYEAIKSIRFLGVTAVKENLEASSDEACSSLFKIGEKSIERKLKINTKQGGCWEIISLEEIGMISAEYGLKDTIVLAVSSIGVLGINAVKSELKDTVHMAIGSLNPVGAEAARYKHIEATHEVATSLKFILDEIIGKEEFKDEERNGIKSLTKIYETLEELEKKFEQD